MRTFILVSASSPDDAARTVADAALLDEVGLARLADDLDRLVPLP